MYAETIIERNGYILIKEKMYSKDTGRLVFLYTIKKVINNKSNHRVFYDLEKEPASFLSLRKAKIRFLIESL